MGHQNEKSSRYPSRFVWIVCCGLMFLSACSESPPLNGKARLEPAPSRQQAAPDSPPATADKPEPDASPGVVTPETDWPFFRGDAKSTGVATTELPDELEVLWEHKVDKGAFEGTPTIVGGPNKIAYIGDLDGTLFAFELDSGKVLWEYKVEIGFVTAPVFKDDHLFIGDIDGVFYCLDSSGKLVWKYQTNAEINSSANFYGSNVLFGSQDTKLYAVDRKTGQVSWELETADQVRCSATVVDNRAFVAGCDGGLHIIDLDKGTEVSSVNIESPTGVTPAVQGDTVFVGTEQSGFFAVDWKRSEVKWKFAPETGMSIRSSPAINQKHVVFGTQNRTLHSLDPETGSENWTTTLKANIDSSPVIVGKRVFVGSTDGRIYAIELESGDILWEKQLNGGIIGSPAVAFGRLVVATDRGVVYCLGSKTRSREK